MIQVTPQAPQPPSTGKEGGDHVNTSPERDTPHHGQAHEPWPGSATRRDTPQSTVTLPLVLLGAALLVCLGLLLGATWTVQALQHKHRRLAEERRKLNEEWLALRAVRRQQDRCPHCPRSQAERSSYLPQVLIQEPFDDE